MRSLLKIIESSNPDYQKERIKELKSKEGLLKDSKKLETLLKSLG